MKSLEYLSKSEPITLVGGSELNSIDLFECLKMAPNLVAVDGSKQTALAKYHPKIYNW